MTHDCGIDTSILVRLATGEPPELFDRCVRYLTSLVEKNGATVFASSQAIGEAYIALQHHYGVSKPHAKAALASVLTSGLVRPQSGPAVLEALAEQGGCGLFDRLIVLDYTREQLRVLTLDEKMAKLTGTVLIPI